MENEREREKEREGEKMNKQWYPNLQTRKKV